MSREANRQSFALLLGRLVRWRLSLCVALTATAGFFLHPQGSWSALALEVGGGVFLLAAGCSALNQVQERRSDARMRRTHMRPLASGVWPPAAGYVASVLLSGTGLALLAGTGQDSLLLGLAAIIWYNGFYTWLKRHSVFALLPGALCGAVPVLIGWSAAGGAWHDYRAMLPALLVFLWQMPHFWLLLSRHRADYREAGLPNLFEHLSVSQTLRLTALWIFALAGALLLLPVVGLIGWSLAGTLYLSGVAALLIMALRIFVIRPQTSSPSLFVGLNLSMAAAMLALVLSTPAV